MIICRLCISFDRGTARNKRDDLGSTVVKGSVTVDGKVIRGLGSHFRSEEARQLNKERCAEEQRIRNAFRRTFVSAPIPGHYILPESGAGKRFLASLEPRQDIEARVAQYDLQVSGEDMPPGEIRDWANRVQEQIVKMPTGRGKVVNADKLEALNVLASAPILAEESREALKALIKGARLQTIDRLTFKRQIEDIKIDIDPAMVKPRGIPAMVTAEVEVEEVTREAPKVVQDTEEFDDREVLDLVSEDPTEAPEDFTADDINAALQIAESVDNEEEPVTGWVESTELSTDSLAPEDNLPSFTVTEATVDTETVEATTEEPEAVEEEEEEEEEGIFWRI
jgi:hypothetical protein